MDTKRIIALRRKLNLTQADLAKRIGVNRVTVWRWEHGKALPHPTFVEAIKELEQEKE